MKLIFANIYGGREFTGVKYGDNEVGDDVLEQYISKFAEYQPDILSLAEVHLEDETHSEMVEELSIKLSLPHTDILGTDKSHLVPGKILGNAILSRYPITDINHFMIKSPGIEVYRPSGDHWVMHDKGAQTVTIETGKQTVALTNLQYFPFHHFNRTMNDPEFAPERQQLVDHLIKMGSDAHSIVTGDFNNKGLRLLEAFPELFEHGFVEAIEVASTVVGDQHQLDHILYRPSDVTVRETGLMTLPSDHLGLYVALNQ